MIGCDGKKQQRDAYRISVRKSIAKCPTSKPRRKMEDNIKLDGI
jgi:hypothetical protein